MNILISENKEEIMNFSILDESSRPTSANIGIDGEGSTFKSEHIRNEMLTGEQTAKVTCLDRKTNGMVC